MLVPKCLHLEAPLLIAHLFCTVSNTKIVGEPPRFTQTGEPPEAVSVRMGEILTLPCGVTGTPTPHISWYQEGSLIDATSVMADGSLVINTAESGISLMGTIFHCLATNRIGPGGITVASLRSRDVNVSLSCKLIYCYC